MADFPYATVTGRITEFFKKIKGIGVPSKVDNAWLKTAGYNSSNDRSLLPVLKFIDFIDPSSGVPTDKWKKYRSSDVALGEGIKQGYKELFDLYPDAQKRNKNELSSFFKSKSNAGEQAIAKTITTFINLCELADFSSDTASHQNNEPQEKKEHPPSHVNRIGGSAAHKREGDLPSLNINIQVHLSSDLSVDQIEQVFASMAKHLYKRD
jgi:hypothetical protein